MMSPEAARISALRMHLLALHPFWGYFLLNTEIIANTNLRTIAATDGHRRIWFNPERTCSLSIKQLGFVMLHEICHHVQSTLTHTHGRNQFLWDHATDYAVNNMVMSILDASFKDPLYQPPVRILHDPRFDGLTVESIYECLILEMVQRKNNLNQLSLPLGPVTLEEVQVADHGGGIDIHLPGPMTAEERDDLEARVQAAVAYWEAYDQLGNMPSEVLQLFRTRPSPVPWQKVLRRYVDMALTGDDSNQRRPSRHWLAEGAWRPSAPGVRLGTIVVALDSNGGMSSPTILEAGAEIRALSKRVQKLYVVVANAQVHEIVDLDQIEMCLNKHHDSTVSTSYIPTFNWIKRQGIQPDLFIGLTDLCGTFPTRPPPYPVLWVTPIAFICEKQPFGRVIEAE